MKRAGNLWNSLIDPENLFLAAENARKRKRFRGDVMRFDFDRERELCELHQALTTKTYQPGDYHTFYVYEPKKRLISAAPFRDRVVHHALTGVLEPIFEPTFISDSYACRQRKGTHAAVRRAQAFSQRWKYVLKADIRKFFPSLDHETLIALLAKKIKDEDALWLAKLIIERSNEQERIVDWFAGDDLLSPALRRRGIPIGNQTSQFFANVYLNPLDHFIKDRLRIKGYVRYVDDFLIFSNDKKYLAKVREQVGEFVQSLLRSYVVWLG